MTSSDNGGGDDSPKWTGQGFWRYWLCKVTKIL